MNLWHIGRQNLTRTACLTMLIASLAVATTQGVGANDGDDAYTNSITQIQVCKAMGGTPEITTIMNGAGKYVVEVICHGGFMNGFTCINIPGDTWCRFDVMDFAPDLNGSDASGVRPLDSGEAPSTGKDDSVPTPAIDVDNLVIVDPIATPNTEPTVAPGMDNGAADGTDVVSEETMATPEATAPVVAEPTMVDAPVVDDGSVSDGGSDKDGLPTLGPDIDPGDILPTGDGQLT
jgi:hypothetical protein